MDNLSGVQVFNLLGLGFALWVGFAVALRYGSQIFFANNQRRFWSYILTIPMGYMVIYFTEILLGLNSKARLASVSIMLMIGSICDGIVFMWFPSIYENPLLRKKNSFSAISYSRMCAAWILWAVAICLGIALVT